MPETPRTWTEVVNGGDVREGDTIWLETRWVTVTDLYPAHDHIAYGYHDGTRGWAASFLVDTPILRACVVVERERLLDLVGELTHPDSCSYDHHGLCQAHFLDEKPCPHERANILLREYGRLGKEES